MKALKQLATSFPHTNSQTVWPFSFVEPSP